MKHDIFFNTKDELLTWLDENFPDAVVAHVASNGATYSTHDCELVTEGLHLTLHSSANKGE